MLSSLSLVFIENSHLKEKKKKLYNYIAWLTKGKNSWQQVVDAMRIQQWTVYYLKQSYWEKLEDFITITVMYFFPDDGRQISEILQERSRYNFTLEYMYGKTNMYVLKEFILRKWWNVEEN